MARIDRNQSETSGGFKFSSIFNWNSLALRIFISKGGPGTRQRPQAPPPPPSARCSSAYALFFSPHLLRQMSHVPIKNNRSRSPNSRCAQSVLLYIFSRVGVNFKYLLTFCQHILKRRSFFFSFIFYIQRFFENNLLNNYIINNN